MEERKRPLTGIVGGSLFLILALRYVYTFIRSGSVSFWGFVWMVPFVLIAVGVFINKMTPLPVIGFAILTFLKLRGIVFGIRGGYAYTVYHWSRYGDDYRFNILTMLPDLMILAAYVLALVFAVSLLMKSPLGQKLQRLWFLPAGLYLGAFVVTLLLHLFFNVFGIGGQWEYSYNFLRFVNFVWKLIEAAGFFTVCQWMAYPDGVPEKVRTTRKNGGTSVVKVSEDKAYCGLVKHILLLVFTFGIWYLIWIYRMTGYLNQVEDEEPRTPAYQLLLCMFVPFYSIYWVYKSAERIDKLAQAKGIQSDLTMLCLILSIFVAIIPPILMQEKVNTILTTEEGAPIVQPVRKTEPAVKKETVSAPVVDGADEIRKYKELLDEGILTQEEFVMKKRQILGLPVVQETQKPQCVEEFDDLPEL